jgi:hypothetical protein
MIAKGYVAINVDALFTRGRTLSILETINSIQHFKQSCFAQWGPALKCRAPFTSVLSGSPLSLFSATYSLKLTLTHH